MANSEAPSTPSTGASATKTPRSAIDEVQREADRLVLDAGGEIRIRPAGRRFLGRVVLPYALMAVVSLVLASFMAPRYARRRIDWSTFWPTGFATILGLIAVGCLLYLVLIVMPVLVVRRDSIVKRGFLGVRVGAREPKWGHVMLFHSAELRVASDAREEIVLVGRNGRRIFRMNGNRWPVERVATALAATGIEVIEVHELVNSPTFRRRHPGMMPWWLRLYIPVAYVLVTLLIIASLIVADVVVWLITGESFTGARYW